MLPCNFVLARCFCCMLKSSCSFFHNFVESYFTLIGFIDDVTTGKRKLRHHFTCHQYKLKKTSQCECLQNLIPLLPTRHRTSYVCVRVRVCVCVCVCVCACVRACTQACVGVSQRKESAKRMASTSDTNDAWVYTMQRKQQQQECACVRVYVTIRRKVRAQDKLDKRHSVQESSSKHNAKKI